MKNNLDAITIYLKKSTDILFLQNPVGTSLGVLSGIILNGLNVLFAPMIESFLQLKVSLLNIWFFWASSIFGFNIGPFVKKKKLSPSINEALQLINNQVTSGKITSSQAALLYNELIRKVISNVELQDGFLEKTKEINKILND